PATLLAFTSTLLKSCPCACTTRAATKPSAATATIRNFIECPPEPPSYLGRRRTAKWLVGFFQQLGELPGITDRIIAVVVVPQDVDHFCVLRKLRRLDRPGLQLFVVIQVVEPFRGRLHWSFPRFAVSAVKTEHRQFRGDRHDWRRGGLESLRLVHDDVGQPQLLEQRQRRAAIVLLHPLTSAKLDRQPPGKAVRCLAQVIHVP